MSARVQANCRLMQDFVAVRPIDAKNDLRAIRVQNRPLVFSIGSDDVLYLIYQDDNHVAQGWTRRALLGVGEKESVTAFGVAQHPTQTDQFRIAAAFKGSDGRNVLKVSRLIDFDTVDWTDASTVANLWTSIRLPDPKATGNEVRIDATGTVLLATTKPPSPSKYYLFDPDTLKLSDYGLPEAGAKIVSLSLGSVWGERGVFLLYDVGTKARTLLFQSFIDPQFGTTFKQRYDIDGHVHDFFVVPDANGFDTVYTCGESVYKFSDPTSRETIVKPSGTVFTQIRAVEEEKKVTLWLRGTSGTSSGLYYVTNQFSAGGVVTITKWAAPILMMANVGQFACERETYVSNHLFAVSNQNTLSHLYQDSETTLWREEAIYLEDTAQAEEISAYVVSAQFYGLPEGKKNRVKVSATSSIYAEVNESSVLIGPRKSVWVDLETESEISVSIPVEDLTVPNVIFTAEFLPSGSVEIDCTERVLEDLGKYKTGTELKNAKAEDGSPVFSNSTDLPSDETFDTVAATAQELVKRAKEMKTTKVASRSIQGSADVNSENATEVLSVTIINGEASLNKTQSRSVQPRSMISSRGLFDGPGNTFGDVMHTIGRGLTKLKNFALEVTNGVTKLVIKLATGVFTFVVKKFEQLMGVLKPLFDLVKKGWEALKKLVSFLFNFKDIIKTKDLLKEFCNESFDVIKKHVAYLKTQMNLYADEAKVQLGAAELNDRIKKAVGNTTLADQKAAAEKEEESRGKESKSSEANFMKRKVRQSARTKESGTEDETGSNSLVKSLVKVFTDAWENLKFIGSRLEELIGNLVTGKISIAEFLLEILKALGAVVIDTAQNVANVVFDLFDTIIEIVRTVLNQKFKIPVISSLLEKFLGVKIEFSLLDVIAFIGAVPVTVIYKLVTGRAPHEDISAAAMSDALNASSPKSSSATIASRSLPRSLLSNAKSDNETSQPRDIVSRSGESRKKAGSVIGIIGGSLGVIRSLTLFWKLAMKKDAPKALQYVDVGLALTIVACALARLGTQDNSTARNLAIPLASAAFLVFVFNILELKLKKIDTKGWVGNGSLTILGVLALIRFSILVAPYRDANIITISLFAALNWFLAAPHHFIKEGDGPPYYLITASLRSIFVLTLSILLIDDSAHGVGVSEAA